MPFYRFVQRLRSKALSRCLALCLFPGCLWAQAEIKPFRVNLGEIVEIEAKQAPLPQIFDAIAQKAGIKMHYSIDANVLVTATCAGENLKQAMDCLMGSKANLMIRYTNQGLPSEIWVLSSSFEQASHQSLSQCVATQPVKSTESNAAHTPHQEIDKLLEMASSNDPAQRAAALSRLSLAGHRDDRIVEQTLKNALTDQNASVRAQAVFGIARRDGSDAAGILAEALNDADASVRMMVVDGAGKDAFSVGLLKQALLDKDKGISELAAIKLHSL